MSLSALIKDDEYLRNKIRDDFELRVLRQRLEKTRPLLAPPNTTNHQLVGTAFDYLLRFYLERLNDLPYHLENQWVAEKAVNKLSAFRPAYEDSRKIIKNVKTLRKKFNQTGRLSRELIRQTLCMSYFDPLFRAGRGIEDIGKDADPADIEDIQKQFSIIDNKLFKSQNRCVLNPTFGTGSQLVGGADADLIIDDKLIDVKTTKTLELHLRDFCQIIGYLLLHRIGGVTSHNENEDLRIEQLGIYYSRYGYLFLFNVKDLIDNKSLDKFTKWFENYLHNKKRGNN